MSLVKWLISQQHLFSSATLLVRWTCRTNWKVFGSS